MLESGVLSEGHGRAILQATERQAQRSLARQVRDRGLSVRETEALARSTTNAPAKPRKSRFGRVEPGAEAARLDMEEQLTEAFGRELKVRLRRTTAGKAGARVEIDFDSFDELREFAARVADPRSV